MPPRATFKQISLRPGRYHLGGGLYRDLTAADLSAYVKGTRAVLAAGHQIPMLFEHAQAGSADGAPVQLSATLPKGNREQRRKQLADQVKHGAGWLRGIEQTKEGDLAFTVEANDPAAIKGLRNKTIKFTSPELREGWTDGKGRTFAKVISHVALTHKPRNSDQSAMTEIVTGHPVAAAQFSLADWQQFSDDDDEEKDDAPPTPDDKDDGDETPENPDAPPDGNDQEDQAAIAQFQALLEHLAADGLDLTADTTPETLVRDLLIAYKTKTAMKALADDDDDDDDEDDDDDDENPDADLHEEKPMVQFSLGDEGVPRLLGLVMQGRHDQVIAGAEAAQRDGQFPPSLTKRIKEVAGAMQFSADADENAVYTVSEVVQMLRETLPAGAYTHWTNDQFSAAQVERPPDQLTSPGEGAEITAEQARKLVDEQSKHIPGLGRRK